MLLPLADYFEFGTVLEFLHVVPTLSVVIVVIVIAVAIIVVIIIVIISTISHNFTPVVGECLRIIV